MPDQGNSTSGNPVADECDRRRPLLQVDRPCPRRGLDVRRWQTFLDALGEFYDAKGLFYVFDAATQRTPIALAYGFDGASLKAYADHYIHLNPYPTAAVHKPTDTTVYAHDVVPAEIVARSQFYSELLCPLDVSLSHLAIKVLHDQDRLGIISMSPGRKVESNPEMAFDRLRPYIRQAAALNRHTARTEQLQSGYEALLQSFSAAAFLLDDACRPLHLSAAAVDLMRVERLFGLDAGGRLTATRPRDDAKLAALTSRAGGHPGVLRLTGSDKATAYLAWTVPVPRSGDNDREKLLLGDALTKRASILLLAVPVGAKSDIPAPLIQEALALTVAESRLLAALVAGDTVASFAERNGLSPKTVRNQLAAVFAKTGTTRQAEIVALVMRTLGPVMGHRR